MKQKMEKRAVPTETEEPLRADLETIRRRAVARMYEFNKLGYFLFTEETLPETVERRDEV